MEKQKVGEQTKTEGGEQAGKAPQVEETAMVKQGEAGLPAELQDFTGMESITPDALIIPRMKIVQPTSKQGTAGNFILNLTDEEFPEIVVTAIKVERGRIMWEEDDLDAPPLCRSYDFQNPDPTLEKPQGDKCMEYREKGTKIVPVNLCNYCKWGVDKKGKPKPPACSEVYNLLCVTEDGIPFWYATSPTSVKAVKKLISAIFLKRGKLFEHRVTMYLEQVTATKGTFYILKFKDIRKLTTDELQGIAESIVMLKDESIQRAYEAEEAMAAEVPDDLDTKDAKEMEVDSEIPF